MGLRKMSGRTDCRLVFGRRHLPRAATDPFLLKSEGEALPKSHRGHFVVGLGNSELRYRGRGLCL
jgi:hypothetical protein